MTKQVEDDIKVLALYIININIYFMEEMIMSAQDKRIETIPVGKLGIIALESSKNLGQEVDNYIVDWRRSNESEHKSTISFAGYQRDSTLSMQNALDLVPVKQRVLFTSPFVEQTFTSF